MTVVGEPGIGKSRLAAELLERIGARAGLLAADAFPTAKASPTGRSPKPSGSWSGFARTSRSRPHERRSTRLSPARPRGGGRRADRAAAGLAGGSTTPEELAWAVRRFLAAAAGGQPLIVVIDDIQWGERVLLDLLAGLPAALPDLPLLALCLARPELSSAIPTGR